MLTIDVEHEGGVLIMGTAEELAGLRETLGDAIDDGAARGTLITDEGVVDVEVVRRD